MARGSEQQHIMYKEFSYTFWKGVGTTIKSQSIFTAIKYVWGHLKYTPTSRVCLTTNTLTYRRTNATLSTRNVKHSHGFKKTQIVPALKKALPHENVWATGDIAPSILNLATR